MFTWKKLPWGSQNCKLHSAPKVCMHTFPLGTNSTKLESPARTVQSKRFLCQSNWISNLFWPLVCRTKVRGASNCLASIKHPSCMHATTTTTVRLLTTTMTDFFYHNNHNNIENDNRRQFALTKCMIVHWLLIIIMVIYNNTSLFNFILFICV